MPNSEVARLGSSYKQLLLALFTGSLIALGPGCSDDDDDTSSGSRGGNAGSAGTRNSAGSGGNATGGAPAGGAAGFAGGSAGMNGVAGSAGAAGSSGSAGAGTGGTAGAAGNSGAAGSAGSAGSSGGGGSAGSSGLDLSRLTVHERRIEALHADVSMKCPQGSYAIGGGCNCGNDGNITRSLLGSDNDWLCACDSEPEALSTPRAVVVCAPEPIAITTVSAPLTAGDTESTVACPTGRVLIGGGISCSDDGTHSASGAYPKSPSVWAGYCDDLDLAQNPRVIGYCVDAQLFGPVQIQTGNITPPVEGGYINCGAGLFGGCACDSSWEMNSNEPTDAASGVSWACNCNAGDTSATMYCAAPG